MCLLALDLDGTSLEDGGTLGEENRAALLRARRVGWTVCFVTGRREVDMRPLGDLSRWADYLLLNNGGKLIRTADGAVLRNILVNGRDGLALAEGCLEHGWQLYAVSGRRWWVNWTTPSGRAYAKSLGVPPIGYSRAEELPWRELEGFMITRDARRVSDWIAAHGLELEVLFSEPDTADVMQRGVCKLSGVRVLAGLLGCTLDETVAVGNYTNDLDMIRGAGVGVAVGDALEEVRRAADYVTRRDHNHGAVAEVVERFVLSQSAGRCKTGR